jgi:hypothetical protein
MVYWGLCCVDDRTVTRDLATVNATIEAAFLDVERDDGCTLHQAQLADEGLRREISSAEWQAAKDKDQETDWRLIPAVFLDECDAALSHGTPRSWRFHLPAYMRRALRLLDADIVETWLPGSVIFHLTFSDSKATFDLERFHMLDASQGGAVRLFLECIRNYPTKEASYPQDADRALCKYWGRDDTRHGAR